MYAVIELQGHQYIIREWDTITVDKLTWNEGDKITVDKVLLAFDDKGEQVMLGRPYIDKASVECTIDSHTKWEKIKVIKFKRKNRYQRTIWFRPHLSVLHINKISVHG